MKEMDEQIVKNAWLHGEYSFFPADVAARSGASIADSYEAHAEMLMREVEEDEEDEIEKLEEEDEVLRMAL